MSDVFDVAVIGMGPTGLTLAATLARMGRRVLIAEKHPKFYGDPRAGHVDHEIVRILYSLDAAEPVMEIAVPVTSYAWRNQHGEMLIDFTNPGESVSGYQSDYMQFQPVLENALVDRIKPDVNVAFLQGWELISFEQDKDGVNLVLRGAPGLEEAAGETRAFRAAFMVGADGANSFVRRELGVERIDLGFNETWLDVDVRVKRPFHLDTPCGQICDPARPKVILPLGKHHRRWEWAIREGETAEQMLDPKTAWDLLAVDGVGPDDVEIIRQILYTFSAYMATQWRVGRVLLAGDAAHTQPPFMGQGMCSGMRDAVNIAWKLDAVLAGKAGEALLDSYQAERYSHTKDWTIISIMSGEVSCEMDEKKAAERDALFRSGFVPPMPEQPYLKAGVVDVDGVEGRDLVGRLALNARVRGDGRTDLFDNIYFDRNWIVMTRGHDIDFDAPSLSVLAELKARVVSIGGVGCDAIDLDGKYEAFFKRHDVDVLIMRPDFYVFGASGKDDVSALVTRLAHRVRDPAPAETDFDTQPVSVAEVWS